MIFFLNLYINNELFAVQKFSIFLHKNANSNIITRPIPWLRYTKLIIILEHTLAFTINICIDVDLF